MSKDDFNQQQFRDDLLDGVEYSHPARSLDDMALLAKQSLARQGAPGYEKFLVTEKPVQPVITDAWRELVHTHGGTNYDIFDRVNEQLANEGAPGFDHLRTKPAQAQQEAPSAHVAPEV